MLQWMMMSSRSLCILLFSVGDVLTPICCVDVAGRLVDRLVGLGTRRVVVVVVVVWCGVVDGSGNGQKLNNSSAPQGYGQSCYQGTVIKLVVDLKKGTLEVFVNKQSQGVMYNNLYGSVRPYMSLTQNQKYDT